MKGKLYLIPTTLGESEINSVIPGNIKEQVEELNFFIIENIRSARRYIRKLSSTKDINTITFYELNKHTDNTKISEYLRVTEKGEDIGLISEAGNPGIADPGADIVAIAHKKNITVVPLVGPSSILMALISSGMNGQNFAFNGYLPINQNERIQKIKFLEKRSKVEDQSQIFMETPFRNTKMLDDILNSCNNNTKLCIACDITLKTEVIKTKTVSEWKRNRPDLNKRPAIFIIHSY